MNLLIAAGHLYSRDAAEVAAVACDTEVLSLQALACITGQSLPGSPCSRECLEMMQVLPENPSPLIIASSTLGANLPVSPHCRAAAHKPPSLHKALRRLNRQLEEGKHGRMAPTQATDLMAGAAEQASVTSASAHAAEQATAAIWDRHNSADAVSSRAESQGDCGSGSESSHAR